MASHGLSFFWNQDQGKKKGRIHFLGSDSHINFVICIWRNMPEPHNGLVWFLIQIIWDFLIGKYVPRTQSKQRSEKYSQIHMLFLRMVYQYFLSSTNFQGTVLSQRWVNFICWSLVLKLRLLISHLCEWTGKAGLRTVPRDNSGTGSSQS